MATSKTRPARGEGAEVARRSFLALAMTSLAACATKPPPSAPSTKPDTPPPLRVPDLSRLLALADLRGAIFARPREIASIPWLIPAIGRVASEDNLGRFAQKVGFDLRQIHEAVIATYGRGEGESTLYLVRHNADPLAIERLFRARLVGKERRSVDRHDVIRVSGTIGTRMTTLVVLGADVVGFQVGGKSGRGPARIASLYALKLLKKSPTALADDPLRALSTRLGEAPLRAFAPGPFEGELARGARGLLAGATAIGATVRPSAREGLLLVIAVAGDFTKSGEAASHELVAAWRDLAEGSFGRLLGLDKPIEAPLPTHGTDAVAIALELDPGKLSRGLSAATSARIEEIMK
jgi:hypothetical protein